MRRKKGPEPRTRPAGNREKVKKRNLATSFPLTVVKEAEGARRCKRLQAAGEGPKRGKNFPIAIPLWNTLYEG